MDFKETLRHQWNEACLQLGLPSLTTDTAAKIMAVLYVYGNNENMVNKSIKISMLNCFSMRMYS